MEATMEVDQQDPELKEWHTFTKARFVMVSRDPLNKGSAIVNRLVAETEEEKAADLKTADFASLQKPKAEYVDCKCQWGLFRDRNVTLRKPVKMHHGMADLSKKGWVEEFDSSKTMNWWQPGSTCDKLGGQDGATLPPGILKTEHMDMFISLMCRRINLEYEKDVEHMGLTYTA